MPPRALTGVPALTGLVSGRGLLVMLAALAAPVPGASAGATTTARPPPTCRAGRYAPADLGFSLTKARTDLPSDPVALRAYIASKAPDISIRLTTEDAARGAARTTGAFPWRGVAGAPVCELPADATPRGDDPEPTLHVVRRLPIARRRFERGRQAAARGHWPEARAEWAAAQTFEPRWSRPVRALAASFEREGRFELAIEAWQRAVAADAASAEAHAGVARASFGVGRTGAGAAALQSAIALAPARTDLVALFSERVIHGRTIPPVAPPAYRAARDGAGVTWIVTVADHDDGASTAARRAEARAYAGCKEAFRASAPLRRDAAGLEGPWRWSVAEEEICTVLWLAEYAHGRATGARPAAPALDDLLALAGDGQLAERALFDVGARAHPMAAALLGEARRAALIRFVSMHRAVAAHGGGLFGR